MTFNNLNTDTICDCVKDALIDGLNVFVRRLKKNMIEEVDFKTHWERGIGKENTDCNEICSYKAVSINLFKPEYEEQILTKYKTTFSINPKKGAYYLKFKLKNNAGKIIHAPEEDDNSHHNLYKADDFNYDKLEILDTIKFV